MKYPLLFSAAIAVLISSCAKDKIEQKKTVEPIPANYCDSLKSINIVSYKCFIDSVLKKNCALSGCHVAGTGLPDYTKYSDVKAHDTHIKDLIQRPESDPLFMPRQRPKLPDSTISKLVEWIDAGALNN